MTTIRISHPTGCIDGHVRLDGSKSISNRVLIIQALCPKPFEIEHLSTSDDTEVLKRLLEGPDEDIYDVGHAGTSFRFLTAYLAFKSGTQVLTGSSRMKERPVGPLVDALNQLGARIKYLEKPGYPPLKIDSPGDQIGHSVTIDAGISSQYLTALLLIAPTLPGGLQLHIKGTMVSESYLRLTLGVLEHFGITFERSEDLISIKPQIYQANNFVVEADWSACSYYFAIAALAKEARIAVKGLFQSSHQGDAGILQLGNSIGVDATFQNSTLILRHKDEHAAKLSYDFINQPDIAQTLAVVCAAKGIKGKFSGLQTLRIKETDRIAALHTELSKVDGSFVEISNSASNAVFGPGELTFRIGDEPIFDTYKDHRMAMAFAPLALLGPIRMNQPEVVTKSYHGFWKDLSRLGFEIHSVSE